MSDVRSPIDHIPVPLRWTADVRARSGRAAQAPARGAAEEDVAGKGGTRAEAAVRAIRITGLLRRKR
ncbi:MAG TPA: hypothetical protein VF615_28820 [Longimicrobiaceae bacterium]|jgi:hypothetical protein